ncbi:MAG TPA: cell division protein SepF [Cryptosporangiaceae bacterium]|nr:cell division protein SepF [Cryptosporangiaceae bacterium]
MGALRKAGVWLGLVEEDDTARYADAAYDDHGYDDNGRFEERRSTRRYDQSRFADRRYDADALDADDEFEEPVPRLIRPERTAARGASRLVATATPPIHDNLALAPQLVRDHDAVGAESDETWYRITTLHPTTYNEARTIGEHFRKHIPVILNLTEMDESDAKRLVDFAAGLTFGLRGSIERVTNRVFLLSPANVTVTAEDKARIAEGGFFNQS